MPDMLIVGFCLGMLTMLIIVYVLYALTGLWRRKRGDS